MITTLLWDIDGTLVDTEPLHFAAWRHMLRQHGRDLTEAEYLPMIGRGSSDNMRDLCEAKGLREDQDRLQQIRRQKFDELRRAGITPIAANIELARRFKQEYPELVHAAVSSARRTYVDENLTAAGLSDFFTASFSLDDGRDLAPKPAPDLYIHACKALGAAPGECLAFEDSDNGAAAAEAAGVRVVRVPAGRTPQEILSIYK